MEDIKKICVGLPSTLPKPKPRDPSVPHAPVRTPGLTIHEKKIAVQNALRYFEQKFHPELAIEFLQELEKYGHIYMYRFRPEFEIRAYPIDMYPSKCKHAAAIMLMIMNNLDQRVAQFPHELVVYGGNGQIFSNWAQFLLVMHYLSEITEDQTLIMYSGHPLGVFPSSPNAPILVITNGMVIPNYSSRENYEKMFAQGVTMYGQMTAGSYCYMGPQGIVHGTTLTIKNAGRKYLYLNDLKGKVFVSSGLGGMSGAQGKACIITECIGVIAEVNKDALYKRLSQGWLSEAVTDLDQCIERIRLAKKNKEVISIGYLGNIVDLWEKILEEYEATGELLADLGSDQTSCHNPFNGGYYPVQLSFQEAEEAMRKKPLEFKKLVEASLRRHVAAINKLSNYGMFFWDYGNAFLLEAQKAGADVNHDNDCNGTRFKYPSYVQDIMGDLFSLGFGPFRWVCTSGSSDDLDITDMIATSVLEEIITVGQISEATKQQYYDNIHWIKEAKQHNMVVGSQARILYSDQLGRIAIALKFNEAIASKKLKSPIVISRDHHDVSATDSPFRETSNIYDGSAFCADMAVQNVIGDAMRGATWVALHNGGGVGWGEVINGGFGMVLDGSENAAEKAKSMLTWDVLNGVARRSWSGNSNAEEIIHQAVKNIPKLQITHPHHVADCVLEKLFQQ